MGNFACREPYPNDRGKYQTIGEAPQSDFP
jgi:hypothetical protein